jgi:hypothetical protein
MLSSRFRPVLTLSPRYKNGFSDTRGDQLFHDHAANVAGSAGDQNFHKFLSVRGFTEHLITNHETPKTIYTVFPTDTDRCLIIRILISVAVIGDGESENRFPVDRGSSLPQDLCGFRGNCDAVVVWYDPRGIVERRTSRRTVALQT